MPVETLTAASTGTYTGWAIAAGSRPSLVNSDDGDTSYCTSSTIGHKDSYVLTVLVPAAITIDNVSMFAKTAEWSGGNGDVAFFMRSYGGVDGSLGGTHSGAAGYNLKESDMTSLRPGGGSWIPTDFESGNETQMGLNSRSNNGVRYTYAYTEVTYTPMPAGAWRWGIQMWLPPLIAAASHALSRQDVISILSRLRTRPSSEEEFCRILEAFRVRPRYA